MVGVFIGWIPGVLTVTGWCVAQLVDLIQLVASLAASVPMASVWVRPPGWPEIAAYGLALVGVSYVLRAKGKVAALVAAVLLLGNLWAWSSWAHRLTGAEMAFLDVGQGDATLIRYPDGATILVDGGPSASWYDAGDWVIVPYCRSEGIRRIDVVISTHPDNDHVGGLSSVLEDIEVGELWYNGVRDTARSFRGCWTWPKSAASRSGAWRQAIRSRGCRFRRASWLHRGAPRCSVSGPATTDRWWSLSICTGGRRS